MSRKKSRKKEKEVEEFDDDICPACGKEKKPSISGNSLEGVGEISECDCP